jgi:hypothetical protein
VQLAATLPPQIENEHMRRGTHAHALLELAVRERRDSVLDFDGQSVLAGFEPLDQSDVEAVQVALDYVNNILASSKDHELYVERQVTLSEDVGGTADVVIYDPETQRLHVIDYKHGVGHYVEAEGNPQLKLYAAATLFGFEGVNIKAIYATIIQPRCQRGEPIRTAVYGVGDLMGYADEVEGAVAAACADNPVFTPGDEQCHWCPCAHICPALHGEVVVTAKSAMAVVSSKPFTDAQYTRIELPSADAIRQDVYALSETLKAASIIRSWLDAVEDHAEQFMLAGNTLPGFKLVQKRASRKWTDEAEVVKWFANQTMLDADAYQPRKLLSVAKAEAAVKKAGGKDSVKAMAGFVIKESSGLKLVPETSAGEAVSVSQVTALSGGSPDDTLN